MTDYSDPGKPEVMVRPYADLSMFGVFLVAGDYVTWVTRGASWLTFPWWIESVTLAVTAVFPRGIEIYVYYHEAFHALPAHGVDWLSPSAKEEVTTYYLHALLDEAPSILAKIAKFFGEILTVTERHHFGSQRWVEVIHSELDRLAGLPLGSTRRLLAAALVDVPGQQAKFFNLLRASVGADDAREVFSMALCMLGKGDKACQNDATDSQNDNCLNFIYMLILHPLVFY